MFGRKLNENVTKELERRKRALDRVSYYNNFAGSYSSKALDGVPEYGLSEMMQKTTYSRLISPMYTTPSGNIHEIKGRLLATTAISKEEVINSNHYKNEYWNTTGDQRGYVPPPGITSIRTAYTGEGATINTIKEADITLRLFSLDQYNLIVPYFVRIGTILYLEYGWSNPKIELEKLQAYPRQFLTTTEDSNGKPQVTMNLDEIQQFPDEFAINTRGNSDIFVGTVTNYDAKMQQDGGFEINISMKTTGHSMYHLPTYSDSRANVKIIKTETDNEKDPFAHNLDERSGAIMLAKAKLLIQEDFNLLDVFSTNIDLGFWNAGEKGTLVGFEQPSFFYTSEGDISAKKAFKNVTDKLKNRGFDVEFDKSESAWDFTAVHSSGDLILNMYWVGKHKIKLQELNEDGTQKEIDSTFKGYKINYYTSVRYVEDNLLSRLFGVVRDDGVISAGIRSLNIPKGVDFEKALHPFKSNKMLTHKLLVPKNFREILVNTEAMSAMLQRTGTGQFKSEGKITDGKSDSGFTHWRYQDLSIRLGKAIRKYGLPFIDENENPKSNEDADVSDVPTNPNHVQAHMRHIYINIELVQESFLGSANTNFCNRNYFPSTGDTKVVGNKTYQRNQILDKDYITANETYGYFQDVGVRFNKEACAKTLREGLYNMWNSISANFHNFPNFEVGANVYLPNFLQVYDLRYTKANEYYEFDVFNKDSIIKSLEFNSQVPTTVQLAATFGASTNFDFDSLLGGTNNGLKEDLLADINKNSAIKKKDYKISNAVSFEKSLYREGMNNLPKDETLYANLEELERNAFGEQEEAQEEFDECGIPVEELDEEAQDAALEEYFKGIEKNQGLERIRRQASLKVLKLQKGDGSTYPMYGIAPDLIKGSKEAIEEDNRDTDEIVRKFYPDLNQRFAEMSDVLHKLFLLDKDGNALFGGSDQGHAGGTRSSTLGDVATSENKVEVKVEDLMTGRIVTREESPSINLRTGAVTIPGINGDSTQRKTLTFTTTYANFTTSIPGQRGATLVDFGTHSDYQAYLDYLIYQDESQSLQALNGTISYFELTFEIDGISGILPGEAFTISYLPDLIKDYFYFIVKNVEQTCSSDGWTTTITALQRRKYFVAKDRKTLPIALSQLSKTKKVEKKPIDVKSQYPQQDETGSDELPDLPAELAPPDEGQGINVPDHQRGTAQIPDSSKAIGGTLPGSLGPIGNTKTNLGIGMEFTLPDIEPYVPEPIPQAKEVPKPNPNFVAYDIGKSPIADITLAFTDGQATLITEPGPDEQQLIKIFPEGDADSSPIAFTLGVTDILSDKEYEQIKNRYKRAFGFKGDIDELLRQMYSRVSIIDENINSRMEGEDVDYGKWDEIANVHFYVANREISEGITVRNYLDNMIQEVKVIGNDDSSRDNSSFKEGKNNTYIDDIIYRILEQPQRTRINVIEIEEEDIVEDKKIDEPEVLIVSTEPTGSGEIIVKDPEPEPIVEEEIIPKKVEPYLSTYQSYKLSKKYGVKGSAWEQNGEPGLEALGLYEVCGGWGTKGAGYTEARGLKKDTDYYGEGKGGTIPFYTRQKFWDEMIQPPNRGGVYNREEAIAQMALLKETGEFANMKPGQKWRPIFPMPDGYNPKTRAKAKSFYEKFKQSGEVFTVEE
tara:strand:- start:674 stop:5578 length:4905 start_codon:yes stop_codon:yes gene_type:complete